MPELPHGRIKGPRGIASLLVRRPPRVSRQGGENVIELALERLRPPSGEKGDRSAALRAVALSCSALGRCVTWASIRVGSMVGGRRLLLKVRLVPAHEARWPGSSRAPCSVPSPPSAARVGFQKSRSGGSAACRTQPPSAGRVDQGDMPTPESMGVDRRLGGTMPSRNPLLRSSASADPRFAAAGGAKAAQTPRHRQESRPAPSLRPHRANTREEPK